MKRLLFITLVFGSFFGCKKDNSKPAAKNSIVAQWYDVKDVYSISKAGVTTKVDSASYNRTVGVLFNSDGTGVGNDANIAQSFGYKVNSNNLVLTEQISSSPGQPATNIANVVIKNLSSNSLELFFTTGPDIDGYLENHDVTYTK